MSFTITDHGYRFSQASYGKMAGVHPALIVVAGLALTLSPVDFGVTCGMRTIAEQKKLLAEGKTQTMNSRHLTGHAIDLAAMPDGKLSWDWGYYHQLAVAMKQAASILGVPIEWGGDWTTFKDGPHFQLPFAIYPL